MEAETGQIVAASLTAKEVDDGAEVVPLLDQVDGTVVSFTAEGAYDQEGVSAAIAERYPEATIIVPPRSPRPCRARPPRPPLRSHSNRYAAGAKLRLLGEP